MILLYIHFKNPWGNFTVHNITYPRYIYTYKYKTMQNKVIRKETYPFAWAPRNPPSLKIRRNISLLSGLSQSDVGTPPRHIKQANKGVSISSVFLSRIGVYWKEEFKKNHKHITKRKKTFFRFVVVIDRRIKVASHKILGKHTELSENNNQVATFLYTFTHTYISCTHSTRVWKETIRSIFSIEEHDNITFWFDQFRERGRGGISHHGGCESDQMVQIQTRKCHIHIQPTHEIGKNLDPYGDFPETVSGSWREGKSKSC